MENVTYKLLEQRQKSYIKAYIVLCVVLLVGIGIYTYKNWSEYSILREGYAANIEYISQLRDTVARETSSYQSIKSNFDNVENEINEKLAVIFPDNDNYTALTRQLDQIEESLNRKTDPFDVSNIDFQDIVSSEEYNILPLRMSIRSSNENFRKFLKEIENSGALTGQMRLMEIASIRLNFEEVEETEGVQATKMINFSVQLNAYFKKIIQ